MRATRTDRDDVVAALRGTRPFGGLADERLAADGPARVDVPAQDLSRLGAYQRRVRFPDGVVEVLDDDGRLLVHGEYGTAAD